MKQSFPWLAGLLAALLLVGCAGGGQESDRAETEDTLSTPQQSDLTEQDEPNLSETSPEGELSIVQLPLEELLAKLSCIVTATYTGTREEYGDYGYDLFQVEEVLAGSCSAETIYVYRLYTEDDPGEQYQAGERYILPLMRPDTYWFYDEYEYYYVPSNFIYFPEQGPYLLYEQEVTPPEGTSFADYLISLATFVEDESTQISVTEGATPAQIMVEEAQFVAYVTVVELESENARTDSYRCKPQTVLKGENLLLDEEGMLELVVAKDSVTVGETYLVAFDQVDESIISVQKTADSVIPSEDAALQQEVEALLAG
jgi:hypothetical protein